jgi:hypothetical protein
VRKIVFRMKKLIHRIKSTIRVLFYLFKNPVPIQDSRWEYQRNYLQHVFVPGERILDIGSGGSPCPNATILADRFLEPTIHRAESFKSLNKPVVICDITALPFDSYQFNYIICSHVLEHIENPIQACKEIQRVAKAGFIESPVMLKDALFSWAKDRHKWHLMSIGNSIIFFEYTTRQLEGTHSSAFQKVIFGATYHPLQVVFANNQDLFNAMLEWKETFQVYVFMLDGRLEVFPEK